MLYGLIKAVVGPRAQKQLDMLCGSQSAVFLARLTTQWL